MTQNADTQRENRMKASREEWSRSKTSDPLVMKRFIVVVIAKMLQAMNVKAGFVDM